MKRLVGMAVAILAFVFGVVAERIFISRTPAELPKVERCDPARIEVKTVFVPPAAAPPLEIFDFDATSPPPSGTFYLTQTPKGFEDFNFVNLWWWEPNDDGEIEGEGHINVQENGVSDDQRTLVFMVTRRRVLLITQSQSSEGFGYRFDGEFIPSKHLEALSEAGKPILRGTLTKTKNGKKVTEHFVSLWREDSSHC